jgi:hypothetical protein
MRKEVAQMLKAEAENTARVFSNRANRPAEPFEVHRIIPLSEALAAVIYLKEQGKKAMAFFYFLRDMGPERRGQWRCFFPTDSHLLGLRNFLDIKQKVEEENFGLNFDDDEFPK